MSRLPASREPNARGEGEQLRRQLVEAASELLLQPQAVSLPSLRAVARACSVSPAAVYLHFASQAELISAVIDEQLAKLAAVVRAAVESQREPRARVVAFALSYAQWGVEHPGAYQLLFETADRLEAVNPDVTHENWDLLYEGSSLIAAARDGTTQDALSAAFRLWAALHGIVSLRVHKSDVPWPTSLISDVEAAVAAQLDVR